MGALFPLNITLTHSAPPVPDLAETPHPATSHLTDTAHIHYYTKRSTHTLTTAVHTLCVHIHTHCCTAWDRKMRRMLHTVLLMALLGEVFMAPYLQEKQAKKFLRNKRQVGYWDPNHSQNMWGYTIQEQANEYWTALRTDAQYYMDMGNLMFHRSVADENNRLYMEMLRNARAHLDAHSGRQR